MLKNTLLTAQRVSEEIRETSRKQAEATVKEAELQADRLIELAQSRARSVEKETLDLRAMRQGLRQIVEEHREREAILKNTLLTAQRVSEDIRETARKQYEAVVKEAEMQADRLIELAQSRAHEVERSILDLRSHPTGIRTDIRALITRLTHLLDLQEEAELEDNLRFLRRREDGA